MSPAALIISTGMNTVFLQSSVVRLFFSFPNNSQKSRFILSDGSRFLGLFRKSKIHIVAESHRSDLVIYSHCRDGKTLSYSRINMVILQLYQLLLYLRSLEHMFKSQIILNSLIIRPSLFIFAVCRPRASDKRGTEDNSKIIFLFLNKNICFDPSLELSQGDRPNDGLQHMF